MPVMPCIKDGKKGLKWGEGGTCYTGPNARQKVLIQARAIFANKDIQLQEDISKTSSTYEPPPSGDAPAEVRRILTRAYSACRRDNKANTQSNKTKCAQIAWGAVANAGWTKTSNGRWRKRG